MRKTERLLLIGISLAFLAWAAGFIRASSNVAIDGNRYFCLFDDAMISMRYAWNLSHGHGLVWNPGEYVQGYTNFLMTLLMAAATFAFSKSGAALCIQVCGMGFMLAIAWMAMRIADRLLGPSTPAPYAGTVRVLAFFCTLAYYPLGYWTLMGMETGLLTVCLMGGTLATLRFADAGRPRDLFAAAICMGLANWTRTDSVVFAAPLGLYLAWEARARRDAATWGRMGAAAAVYFGFIAALLIFQKAYYGDLLPNTYTLKLTGRDLLPRVADGYTFSRPWLDEVALILVLALLDLVFAFHPRKLLLAAMVAASLAYEVYVGGDPWRYWRIMAPTVPLAAVLAVHSLAGMARALSASPAWNAYFARRPLLPAAQALMVLAALLMMRKADAVFWKEVRFVNRPYSAESNGIGVSLALALDTLTTPDATIGLVWAGTTPYYSGRKSVDFLGKCDRRVARLPPDESGAVGWGYLRSVAGHNKYDLDWSIKTLRPDFVSNLEYGRHDVSDWAAGKYAEVEFRGLTLILAMDSPRVRWDRLGGLPPAAPDPAVASP